MSVEQRWVDPRNLYLPPSRAEGADLVKLHDQRRRFGADSRGMPPVVVHLDPVGEMVVYDGVTRAVRMATEGKLVEVEISRRLKREIAKMPIKLPRIGERLPGP